MPVLSDSELTDLLQQTMQIYNEGKYTDLTQTYQSLHVKRFMEQYADMEDGGSKVTWRVQVTAAPEANVTNPELYGTDALVATNLNTEASMNWRRWQKGYILEEHRLAENAGSQRKILDYALQEYHASETTFWTRVENTFWRTMPAADDGTTPLGINYFMVRDHTGITVNDVAGGLTGVNAFSGVATAGVTHDQWRTRNIIYAAFSETDAVRKIEAGYNYSNYHPVAMVPGFGAGAAPVFGFYMPYTAYDGFRRASRAQNDNLGFDFASPTPTYRGVPMVWVPAIDGVTTQPIYGIDWNKTRFKIQRRMNGQEYTVPNRAGAHMQNEFYKNWSLVLVQHDRRTSFIMSLAS